MRLVICLEGVGGAEGACQLELLFPEVHADERSGPCQPCSGQYAQPDPSHSVDHHRGTLLDLDGVHRGTETGCDCAADQGRHLQRDLLVDRDAAGLRNDRVLGKAGQGAIVVDRPAVQRQAGCSIQESSCPECLFPGFAEGWPPAGAVITGATSRCPAQRDMFTRPERGDSFSEGFDDPRPLVSQGRRQGVFGFPGTDVPVTMTDSRSADPDQDLFFAGRGEIESLDLKGLPHFFHNSCPDLHRDR